MKIYLINLDRAADRRDYMLTELARLLPGTPVIRAMCNDIKAPDWVVPDFVTPGRWRSDRWSLGASDIEIFRSHIDCWEKISASGEMGLVLEDDLLFSDQFADAIAQLEAKQIRGIVRLDGVGRPLILEKNVADLEGFSVREVGSLTASAAAYMLDPKTAADLVADVHIERTVDDYLFDPTPGDRGARGHGLPILQLEPAVAIQAQFGSYVDSARSIPPYLLATKRVDVSKRRAKVYLGPFLYRARKEALRALYRRRLAKRIDHARNLGGSWGLVQLCPSLRWD